MVKTLKINGQTAAGWIASETQALPTFIFYPGVGGSIERQGPLEFIRKGWAPSNINLISIQPTTAYGSPQATAADIAEIKKQVKTSAIILTGLSAGMGRIVSYFSQVPNHGTGAAILFSYLAHADQKDWREYPPTWGLVGDQDRYKNSVLELIAGIKSVGTATNLTIYPGDHENWQTYYNPAWKQDGESIYDWALKQVNAAPIPVPEPEPIPTTGRRIMLPVREGGVYVIDAAAKLGVKEGDTLVIPATATKSVKITGFKGSPDAPVILEAEDPAGWIAQAGAAYGLAINDAQHFRVRKINSGDAISNKVICFAFGNGTSNYIVEDVKARNGAIGIMAKWNATEDPATQLPNVVENITIRRVEVDTMETEGLYIGNTWNGADPGLLKPARLLNVTIQDVKTNNTGWDGVQVAHAGNVTVERVQVRNYGWQNNPIQSNGVIIGGYVTTQKVQDLYVENGTAAGLTIFGRGVIHAKNVKLVDVAKNANSAIYIDDYTDAGQGLPVQEVILENVEIVGAVKKIENRNSKGTAKPIKLINVTTDTPAPIPVPVPQDPTWPKKILLKPDHTWEELP